MNTYGICDGCGEPIKLNQGGFVAAKGHVFHRKIECQSVKFCPCGKPIDTNDTQQNRAEMCETCLGDAQ